MQAVQLNGEDGAQSKLGALMNCRATFAGPFRGGASPSKSPTGDAMAETHFAQDFICPPGELSYADLKSQNTGVATAWPVGRWKARPSASSELAGLALH